MIIFLDHKRLKLNFSCKFPNFSGKITLEMVQQKNHKNEQILIVIN